MHIAIDGGTTNTRAALVRDGAVVASARRAVGVRDAVRATTGLPLFRAIEECIREVMANARVDWPSIEGVAACGMLTSSVGMLELGHVSAPAGVQELARGVVSRAFPSLSPLPIHFVRGVRVADDMMRGEECEVFGLLMAMNLRGPVRILLPGSHSKWIDVDSESRIVGIRTSMAGELLEALARNSILKGSLPETLPAEPHREPLREGALLARQRGFFNAAFQTRIADVLRKRSPEECAALLIGATYGGDLWELTQTGLWDERFPLLIAGGRPLKSIYADLAKELATAKGLEWIEAPDDVADDAAARGALAIAFGGGRVTTNELVARRTV